jgi:hypothetical protein
VYRQLVFAKHDWLSVFYAGAGAHQLNAPRRFTMLVLFSLLAFALSATFLISSCPIDDNGDLVYALPDTAPTKMRDAWESGSCDTYNLIQACLLGAASAIISIPITFCVRSLFAHGAPLSVPGLPRALTGLDQAKVMQWRHKQKSEDALASLRLLALPKSTPSALRRKLVLERREKARLKKERKAAKLQAKADKLAAKGRTPKVKKQKPEVWVRPRWTTRLAYGLSWSLILACGTLITLYGLSMPPETAVEWISASLTGIGTDVLVTNPLKLLLFAFVSSAFDIAEVFGVRTDATHKGQSLFSVATSARVQAEDWDHIWDD